MRNLQQNTGAITVLADFGTAVAHILKHTQGIVNQLMALVAVDVDHHANTTCVMLILALIETVFLCLEFTI